MSDGIAADPDAIRSAASLVGVDKPRLGSFLAGSDGQWQIARIDRVTGDGLASADRVSSVQGEPRPASAGAWVLRGTTSNSRYTHRQETKALTAVQEGLGRPIAIKAALIPIRKSMAWWSLSQDERRAVFEEQSHHIRTGLDYLPGVARRLYHSRDLGEPFDFLTWFEYAPELSDAFERLLDRLRATPEWAYVDREVDIRLTRCPAT